MLEAVTISVLSACGAATVLSRPGPGPGRWIRRRVEARFPQQWVGYLLGCRVCSSVWFGALFGGIAWLALGERACLSAALIAPFILSFAEGVVLGIQSSGCGCSGPAQPAKPATGPAQATAGEKAPETA